MSKVLGDLVDHKFNMSQQCGVAYFFKQKQFQAVLEACVLLRPHLEYYVQVQSPHFTNFDKVECIQKTVTRMGLKILSIMSSEKLVERKNLGYSASWFFKAFCLFSLDASRPSEVPLLCIAHSFVRQSPFPQQTRSALKHNRASVLMLHSRDPIPHMNQGGFSAVLSKQVSEISHASSLEYSWRN